MKMNGQEPVFVIFSAYSVFLFLPKKILHAFAKIQSWGNSRDTFQLTTDNKDLSKS